VIAVNVGDCIIPLGIAIYQLSYIAEQHPGLLTRRGCYDDRLLLSSAPCAWRRHRDARSRAAARICGSSSASCAQ
jgi:hypothetical protein